MYLLIFGSSLGLIYASEKVKDRKLKKILIFLALFVPSLFAGLRDFSIGHDVLLYGNGWFERAGTYNSLFDYLEKAHENRIGIGYATVNFLISRVTSDAHVFYFLYEFLQLVVLYFALKPLRKEINITYAFFVYYFCYYNLSFSMLRQIMAILIVFYSYHFILNKKLVKFVVAILLAYSFHSTGIIGIVLYPISWAIQNKNLRQFARIGIILASLLMVLGYEYIFNFFTNLGVLSAERYSHYLTDSEVGGRFVRLGYWGIWFLLIMWRGKKCVKFSTKSNTIGMFMIISSIMSFVTFFGSTWIIRGAYYFDIFQVLFLPILAENLGIKMGNSKKKISYFLLGVIITAYWLITFIIRNGAATYPYVFIK